MSSEQVNSPQPSAAETSNSPSTNSQVPVESDPVVREQVKKRRTFAIISHPDAGKTTLTEKLLLYSGYLNVAGSVRARKNQRAVTSDWMAMERERGISITSTVLNINFQGFQINLLDTPGHQDFSEDTYRTLTAADCAVMVIDAAKGIEAQTEKLFKVCALRKIPILTFINKMDRPGREPLQLLGEIEEVLGIGAAPLNWPIGSGTDFQGVYDRLKKQVNLFEPVAHGSLMVPTKVETLDAESSALDPDLRKKLRDEIELLDGAGASFDRDKFLRAEVTPVFFGSALTNFGIEPFLSAFLELSPPPGARDSDKGPIPADRSQFAGFIFKIQANMDPRHRDRIAFVRVCSGRFVRDMSVQHVQSGESIRISRSHRLFANNRESMDEAYPGDIIGIVNPGGFHLGDTLCEGKPFQYKGMPQFSPEHFAILSCNETLRRKQFVKGIDQLVEEGAIQILNDPNAFRKEPILAAVGQLQFEVVQYRLEAEYGAKTSIQKLPYSLARWVEGTPEDLEALQLPTSAMKTLDRENHVVALFGGKWELEYCMKQNPKLEFKTVR
ncbi:MAG TPA: peptide chain release factor 3 [Planctomycetota bacterium]|nr:peptide chain release factor 3 [Planctomycetota bacterium]